ncbi:MAG: FAD binding domain-containing protein [Deltaproteobacteria bacterium]|nr:FAD binding domain-containing protein [Deltaproteobacteria bacterium]
MDRGGDVRSPPFVYARPESSDEAATAARAGALALAGGTDALVLLRLGLARAQGVLDLKPLGWREIEVKSGGVLELGALATMAEIASSALVREGVQTLALVCGRVATPQIRNVATLGGNLLQAPRCPYYRGGFACMRTPGGAGCPPQDQGGDARHLGIFPGACVAAHPSDVAVVLVALGAGVVTTRRTIAVEELHRAPDGPADTILEPGELVTKVLVPMSAGTSAYARVADRASFAFALAAAAVRLKTRQGRIADVRIALGGLAPRPIRARAAEDALTGADPADRAALDRAADAALDGARPLPGAEYKLQLARVLVVRAIEDAARSEAG